MWITQGKKTFDAMSLWLKTEAKLYFGLNGALRDFDVLAAEFMKAAEFQKENVLKRAMEKQATVAAADGDAANYYVRHMRVAVEKGAQWFKQEYERIQWILANTRLVPWQREHFTLRANRLTAFISPIDDL